MIVKFTEKLVEAAKASDSFDDIVADLIARKVGQPVEVDPEKLADQVRKRANPHIVETSKGWND